MHFGYFRTLMIWIIYLIPRKEELLKNDKSKLVILDKQQNGALFFFERIKWGFVYIVFSFSKICIHLMRHFCRRDKLLVQNDPFFFKVFEIIFEIFIVRKNTSFASKVTYSTCWQGKLIQIFENKVENIYKVNGS